MRKALYSTLLLGLVFLTDSPARATSTAPASPGAAGRRVFTELETYYADHERPPDFAGSLGDLRSTNPLVRRRAGAHLLALFVQLEADERTGRAEWKPTPFWGGGAESDARDLRTDLAERFGREAEGGAAFDALAWLVEHEPVPALQASAMGAMGRVRSPRIPELIDRILSTPHPNSAVLVAALGEVRAHPLPRSGEHVRRLGGHFQARVREAARVTAASMGLGPLTAFDSERAMDGTIETFLRDILARLTVREARDARWVRAEGSALSDQAGWVLAETDSTVRILSVHGRDVTVSRSGVSLRTVPFADEAARWARLRAQAHEGRQDALSLEGGLTGRFESGAVSIPEALVAAWAFERGDRAAAARLLLPCLDGLLDVRELDWIVRDRLGDVAHQAMLAAFSYDRDYPRTIALARHLGSARFDGYRYQERARELAAQLPGRATDFTAFVLPDSGEWAALKSGLSRPEQIEYLAARLRLLNCFQWMQPGGVGFSEPQFEQPRHFRYPFDDQGRDSRRVVNPWVELLALKPRLADFDALAPFVLDRSFMPTFGFWRDFHPDRELYRVCDLVARAINWEARKTLVDADALAALSERERQAAMAEASAWAREHGRASPSQLRLEVLRTSKVQNEFWSAMDAAAKEKDVAAASVVLARLHEFPRLPPYAAHALYLMGGGEAIPAARAWMSEPLDTYEGNMARQGLDAHSNRTLHFWAAMILLRGGEDDRASALAMLERLLAADDELYWAQMGADSLLATAGRAGEELLCRTFRAPAEFITDENRARLLRGLIRGGCVAAYDFVHIALADTSLARMEPTLVEGRTEFRRRSRGDGIAGSVSAWRAGPRTYEWGAPDDARAVQRQSLRDWLAEEFAKIKAGQASDL